MANLIGRLRIVTADVVESRGASHYVAPNGYQEAPDARVINGAVEQSNTNPMVGMVDLIQATRYFEIYQKAIQTSDQMDGQINSIARN
jgi:flagellar basal body rod protein FlgG